MASPAFTLEELFCIEHVVEADLPRIGGTVQYTLRPKRYPADSGYPRSQLTMPILDAQGQRIYFPETGAETERQLRFVLSGDRRYPFTVETQRFSYERQVRMAPEREESEYGLLHVRTPGAGLIIPQHDMTFPIDERQYGELRELGQRWFTLSHGLPRRYWSRKA